MPRLEAAVTGMSPAAAVIETEPALPGGLPEPHAERVLAGMAAACDFLPMAMFAVDDNARILFCNRRARRHLDVGSGIRESHGRLRCEFSEDSSRLTEALRRAFVVHDTAVPIVVTARRGNGSRRFELLLGPVPAERAVVVFASAPEEPLGFSQALARQLYGLSERESEVASAVVAGLTLEETAESLKVEKETVRSHLKRVFSKTETSRQAELVRLLSIGLFGLETPR
jgi:DNA-binding CsgD family transcriptional regulator